VIEAVFEDRAIKADVTQRAEAQLAATAVFASNTSTLPITGLAQASARPANFIGLHFFSPVDKMPLVEIIVGKDTSDETLARASTTCCRSARRPSSSTTAAASTPAACSAPT
jgi:3-hydroxyacyl-CoA dehydrogenase/enoyl-CoA hydratase/3-hydroxybutyryl-CoA epimerase